MAILIVVILITTLSQSNFKTESVEKNHENLQVQARLISEVVSRHIDAKFNLLKQFSPELTQDGEIKSTENLSSKLDRLQELTKSSEAFFALADGKLFLGGSLLMGLM